MFKTTTLKFITLGDFNSTHCHMSISSTNRIYYGTGFSHGPTKEVLIKYTSYLPPLLWQSPLLLVYHYQKNAEIRNMKLFHSTHKGINISESPFKEKYKHIYFEICEVNLSKLLWKTKTSEIRTSSIHTTFWGTLIIIWKQSFNPGCSTRRHINWQPINWCAYFHKVLPPSTTLTLFKISHPQSIINSNWFGHCLMTGPPIMHYFILKTF